MTSAWFQIDAANSRHIQFILIPEQIYNYIVYICIQFASAIFH